MASMTMTVQLELEIEIDYEPIPGGTGLAWWETTMVDGTSCKAQLQEIITYSCESEILTAIHDDIVEKAMGEDD